MSRQTTPSALDRIHACPSSAALPAVYDLEGSADASRGTLIHAFLHACHEKGREEALAGIADEKERLLCSAVDLERIPWTETMRAEVPLVYDPGSGRGRILEGARERDYAAAQPWEIPGTADLLDDLPEEDLVYVGDFKCPGRKTPPIATNWQLRTYALAAARALGRSGARISILHVDPETGEVWEQTVEIDAFELSAFEGELLKLLARVDHLRSEVLFGREVDVTRGDHCTYCPAWRSCPGTVGLARQIAAGDVAPDFREFLTPENAGLVLARVKEVEKLLKEVKEELKAYAERSPFSTIGGGVYGPMRIQSKVLDEKALAYLESTFGEELVRRVCPPKVTLGQIKELVKIEADRQGLKVAPLERSVHQKLEEQGLLRVVSTTQIREH